MGTRRARISATAGSRGTPPSVSLVALRVQLVHVRHALWWQHRSDDPEKWDHEPEDQQDPVAVLERPDTKKKQQKDVDDSQSDV
jgi:hypothetical protein